MSGCGRLGPSAGADRGPGDAAESDELARLLPAECVAFEMLPRILLRGGRLSVLSPDATRLLPVTRPAIFLALPLSASVVCAIFLAILMVFCLC